MSRPAHRTFSTSIRFDTGQSILEREMLGETALTLGRLGRAVEAALADLAASPAAKGSAERGLLAKAAARVVWFYFIQRECCGMTDHRPAIADFGIPPEVLARVGSSD